MSSISPIRSNFNSTTVAPAAQPAGGAAPASYGNDWNAINPHTHIFDFPYDGWKMNSFPISLGGIGFWTGGPMRKAITSMITGIPQDRLSALAVRTEFMKVPGMTPDYARVLQATYLANTQGQQPMKIGNFGSRISAPLSWLAQYGAPGGVYDWTLRGPLEIEMNTIAMQMTMYTGFRPSVPGNNALETLAQQAMRFAPPLPPGYLGYAQAGTPYGYADPIQQTVGLIGQIVNIFR
ncbi:MAG: hypothetical protein JWM80_457 [Cyanobacteria bacterium RYN_339]|nr:hypothetical protein [Cyanobacteria bacterium RYN_339]